MFSFKKKIASITIFRHLALYILRRFNLVIAIKHDVTKRALYIESYTHKGYWYYGKSRELHELDTFNEIIQEGDKVLEIGGHIGYLTQVFEDIVGQRGIVVVCEPTPSN